jgi:argininosuccinate lyase
VAHALPLARDAARFLGARASADVCALGAGALAGSTIDLDPGAVAARLGFAATFENSIDAVSDRDFVLEFLAASAILGVHLSRLAEDVVLWATREFGFAKLPDRHSTGSSMMPQKRNPDVAELTRGKAGRLLGHFVALATAMKSLPLAYDRDLQEDKEPVFDAFDTLSLALPAMAALIAELEFDLDRMADAIEPNSLATDIAEALVIGGRPFRETHATVAGWVAELEREGRTLADASADEWEAAVPGISQTVISSDEAVERRRTAGGPSAPSVKEQLVELRNRLANLRAAS